LDPLNAAISKLRSIPGVVDVWLVDVTERERILQLEERASATPGFAGLNVVNEGIKLVLRQEFVVCINHSSGLRHPPGPILTLTAGSDAIGEEVWGQAQVTRLQADPDVSFVGKSFILHRDRLEATGGKPLRFVIGPQGFPELEKIGGICDVLSVTLSPTTDIYVKGKAGWPIDDLDRGTVLIGFNSRVI
jgi:hypothetical protein